MPKRCSFLLLAGTAIGVSGCMVGPDYQLPDVSVPRQFATQPKANSKSAAPTTSDADLARWWPALNDRALDALVDRAVASNLDIEAVLARVQRARIQQIAVIGAALPEVGISAGAAAGTGTDLTKGRVANSLRAGSSTSGLKELSGIVGFDGGWELDVFGKYRRLLEASRGDTEALAEMRRAVLITVIADVVRTYINIRGLEARLEFARSNVATAQKTVDIVQTRLDRGLTSEFDVTLARRQLAILQARPSDLKAAILDARSRLAILLGTYSEEIAPELRLGRGIPRIPDHLQPGLPLDLLRRRPDIRQAEREVAAATARIGAVTADLFPTLSVTAGFGTQGGPGLSNGTTPATPPIRGPIWSIGPSAYWPFLDFGRLDALIIAQEFQTQELLVNYKKTILVAVAEVDTTIDNFRAARQHLKDLQTALAASRRAVDLALERYDRGLTDFLNVLDAQRQQFELEQQSVAAQEAVAIQFVLFYKALGGGWERYEALPPIPKPQPAIVAAIRRLSSRNAPLPLSSSMPGRVSANVCTPSNC
jgi:NodT family efflux transporter outer membrane factor (OMF) lipoprotein